MKREEGFTLIEVLVALAIFAIGSLGVLAMVGSTIDLNRNARQNDEATALALLKLERLQTVSTSDPELACTSRCWEDFVSGAITKSTSVKSIKAENVRNTPDGTSIQYQVSWIVESEPSAFMQNGRHITVTVSWPRDAALQGTPVGIDCSVGANSAQCHNVVFHTVRKI